MMKGVRHTTNKLLGLSPTKLGALMLLYAVGIIVCTTLSTGLVVARFSRGTHVNAKHDLVDGDGMLVRTSSSESFSSLTDLPAQGPHFLEKMRHLSIHEAGAVVQYTITGFRRANASYLELETTRGRDVIIAAGKAFMRETRTGKIIHVTTPAAEPECGRRLSSFGPRFARSYSWDGIVSRYHAETANQTGSKSWRRLSEGTQDPMRDLYEWFGALISSDAAQDSAEKLAAAALEAAFCDYDTRGLECAAYESAKQPQPPVLNSRGLNKLLLSASDGLWLLYLDFSDWADNSGVANRQRRVRSKLASGVTVDPADSTGTEIRVTENLGSSMFTYQMMHPAVLPSTYNFSHVSITDQGLALAEKVLESASYDSHKGDCREEDMQDEEEEAAVAAKVGFNCEDGTFTWSVAGWRLRAAADGSLKTLEFAKATTDGGTDQSAIEFLSFRVLSLIDGSNKRANYLLSRRFENGDMFKGCTDHVRIPHDNRSRSLRSKRWPPPYVLPGTNWCGFGQCGTDKEGCRHNYCLDQFDADWACRRHDACPKTSKLGGITVLACSCDRDLVENRGTGINAGIILRAFGSSGFWPCISHEKTCRKWGWVRKGWTRYWGIISYYTCDDWNYIRKFRDSKIQDFGYAPQINGFNVNNRSSWPGCVDNKVDPEVLDYVIPGNPWR